jgi:hypothetical protein
VAHAGDVEGNARDQPPVRLKPVHGTSHRPMVAAAR